MKKIYYYEITDDGGITWTLGKPSFYLLNCVDAARKTCYPFRITKAELNGLGSFVSDFDIDDQISLLNKLDKLYHD